MTLEKSQAWKMQARIASITSNYKATGTATTDVPIVAQIDVHDGREWHYDAIQVIRDDIHEASRVALAICKAIDKLPQRVARRPR